ncbi:MAG: 5-oxoprolinase subunit PxpA [Pyrinomonadaceae bacterium]
MGELKIDLNCDVGEGCGNDAALMSFISSANIACGYHAGDAETMKRTVDLALEHNVAIGAHPGFADRESFGRTAMNLSLDEVRQLVADQIEALSNIAAAAGGKLIHVKPHGALYNQAARDAELAAAIARTVADIDNSLFLLGLSGSVSITEAQNIGLGTASEVFADRTYQNDGSLTPRKEVNALIRDTEQAVTQVLDMIKYGRVRSVDSIMIKIVAETVCIHGDNDNAVEFARAINEKLTDNGIEISRIHG